MLWIGAGVIGLVSVAPELDRAIVDAERAEIVDGFAIPRAPDGQFYTEARVGGVGVRFLVDPSIDDVLLAPDDAARLGLVEGQVSLPGLAIGPRTAGPVAARVASDLPVSLLGRSGLALFSADIQRDRLVLR